MKLSGLHVNESLSNIPAHLAVGVEGWVCTEPISWLPGS